MSRSVSNRYCRLPTITQNSEGSDKAIPKCSDSEELVGSGVWSTDLASNIYARIRMFNK